MVNLLNEVAHVTFTIRDLLVSGIQVNRDEDRVEECGPHHQRQVQVRGVGGGAALPDRDSH